MSDQERCRATNKNGQRCSATPPFRNGFCLWHDPERAAERSERARKGGKASSNLARARKRFKGSVKDFADLQGVLILAMDDVKTGKLEPGAANAMANLARAIQSLAPVASFDDLMTELRTELAEVKALRIA